MSLKEKIKVEVEKRKTAEDNFAQYSEKIITHLPLRINEFVDTIEKICKGTEIEINRIPEKIELFLHFDKKRLGTISVETIVLNLFEKNLKFQLEPGIGYIGADAKISIITNVKDWKKKFDLENDGIFINLRNLELDYIDSTHKAHVLTNEQLENLIAAILT